MPHNAAIKKGNKAAHNKKFTDSRSATVKDSPIVVVETKGSVESLPENDPNGTDSQNVITTKDQNEESEEFKLNRDRVRIGTISFNKNKDRSIDTI